MGSTATPAVKLEDDENSNLNPLDTAGSSLKLEVKMLLGSKPMYLVPQGLFVDEDEELIYLYWQDTNHGPYRLSVLSLITHKWTEKKRLLKLQNSWSPISKKLDRDKAPLPPHRSAADAFSIINEKSALLIFGGVGAEGAATSDLFCLCPDMSKWWKVEDICGEVAPRMDAKMTFIDNRLYVFGGRKHESYSIAYYNTDTDKWAWIVCDEPYPSYVPRLGYSGNVTPVYGGTQILLVPGCTDETLNPVSHISSPNLHRCFDGDGPQPRFDYSASQVVLFDVAHRTFHVYDNVEGEFPRGITRINSFAVSSGRLLDGRLAVKPEPVDNGILNTCSSVVIATWHESSDNIARNVPELWLLNLSTTQTSNCIRLDVQKKLEALDVTIACCVGLAAERKIILLGSSSLVLNEGVFDRCVIVDF
ncbi:hypothetical protein DXG01_004040 [Tephrocybe rancida]|nr:hypothetical protein DXG01_004040 [Tephrocybe rancida]